MGDSSLDTTSSLDLESVTSPVLNGGSPTPDRESLRIEEEGEEPDGGGGGRRGGGQGNKHTAANGTILMYNRFVYSQLFCFVSS